MSTVRIPSWNADGVIPPNDAIDPTSENRSPYRTSLTDFVLRFAKTSERRTILGGLLRYRAALHGEGLTSGFQWVNGSFLENVEENESRPPRDIDVVTFYYLPQGATQRTIHAGNPALFDPNQAKATYHVDGFPVCLEVSPERLVKHSAYWYSVWSHRRNRIWKGYVELDLGRTDDQMAAALLAEPAAIGGNS